jgi:HSP20 family protein
MYKTFNIFEDMFDLRNTINNFINDRMDYNYSISQPLVNIYEKDDYVTIKAIASGVSIENVNLELMDNRLNISINKLSDHGDEKYVREERIFGEFSKSVKLPYKVNTENIDASLKDGILTIVLEKSEDAKPKKIEIH